MMQPDTINSVFEGGGAVLLCLNVRRLYRDKTLAGVSIVPTVWWNVWGFWNVYYYSALGQPLSFWAGLGVVVLNTVWVALALYYRAQAQLCPRGRGETKAQCPHARIASMGADICCDCGEGL